MNKKYIIEVATNPASLKKLRDDLQEATRLPKEGVEVPELSRETKAKVKKDLATLFGVADHQADALRKMVQGIIPSDAKGITNMKNQLKETLDFATGIMQKMQQIGDSTDWMKQGVGFVDDFTKMQTGLTETQEVVKGLEGSVHKLTKTFDVFKDALAETNADAFLQRFGNSTRSEAESLARAQKELEKIVKNRNKALQNIMMESSDDNYDYSSFSADEIKAEYKAAIQTIEDANKEIENLRNKFKGRTKELYKSSAYQEQIAILSDAMNQIKNLPSISGDEIGGNLKASLKEATDSVQAAGNEIKKILDGLQKEGIEIAITLPDASSAEFTSKIKDFVSKASDEFKKNPVEVSFDIASSLKNDAYDKNGELKKLTKKQQELSDKAAADFKKAAESAGVEVNDDDLASLYHKNVNKMARNVIDAFTQMYGAMTSGQKLLKTAAESWRRDMSDAFTVKPKFNTEETKQNIKNAIADLQNEFDISDEDSSNFWIVAKPDTRNFIQDVQNAIQGQSVTVDVKAGNIDGSDAVINVGGMTMASGGTIPIAMASQQKPQESSAPRPVSNLPSEQTPALNTNSVVVAENTHAQNVLSEAIKQLDFNIGVNKKRIELIDSSEDSRPSDEIIASINARLEEMTRSRAKLVEEKTNIEQQRKVETDSSKYDALLKRERDIETTLASQWAHYVELEAKRRNIEYRQTHQDDDADGNGKKTIRDQYEKENRQLEKYKKSLTAVMENGENPTKLVLDELKSFWIHAKKEIQKASDNGDVVTEHRWKTKASSMIAKGLDITKLSSDGTMDLIDDDEAIKIVENVLKRNKALAGTLLQDDALKTSAYVKRMGYYIPELQKTMGIIPQSTLEADNELNLNENFKAALKLNEYIKRARDLLKIKDVDVDPSSIQKFIDYFRYFPEMASSVEHAQKYLTEMQGVSDEPWKSKDQKTYQTQIAEIWDTLDTQYKQQFLDALNGTEAASGKNITWIKDFRDDASYSLARDAYFNTKEFYGLEGLLSTDNPQLQQILDILRRSSLLNKVKTSSRMFDDGNGILPSLYGLQRDSGTMHATVIGRNGQEKVLELNGGKTTTESDKRYTYAPKSFQRFINNSGVKTEIDDLVTAMFDPTILLRDRLEAEVRQLEAEIANLKIGHFSANAFDGTPLEKSWKEQKSKLAPIGSLRDYVMNGSVDDYLYHNFKNIRQEKNKESLIRKMKNQGYIPDYLQEKIKDLTDSEKQVAIQDEIKILERDLVNLKSHNKEFAVSKLSELQSELRRLMQDNQQAILELIQARSRELEAKREELKAAEIAAAPAEHNVATKSEALFGSGKFRLSANATQAKPLWAQEEGFSKTPLGRYQEKLKQNKPQQERILAEIKDIENGIYNDAITKRLGGLSEEAQKLEIQKIIAEKKALYDRLNVTLPTQEEILQSLLVRDKDIKIAEAKANREASRSNKREGLAERITSGDDKNAYNTAVRNQRNAIEKSDYRLEALLSRIGFADQTGLMDTSELKALVENYQKKLAATLELPTRGAYMTTRDSASNEAQREINKLENEAYKAWENYENVKKAWQEENDKFNRGEITEQDLQSSGLTAKLEEAKAAYETMRNKIHAIGSDANVIESGTIEDFGNAYEELFQARKALLDKFFDTKGWNVAQVLEDKLNVIDGELARAEQEIRSRASNPVNAIEAQMSEIQAKEVLAKKTADDYADRLYQKYIVEPQEAINLELQKKENEINKVKQDAEIKKSGLIQRAQSSTMLKAEIAKIQNERSKDNRLISIEANKNRLRGVQNAISLLTSGEIADIRNRYNADADVIKFKELRQNLLAQGKKNTTEFTDVDAKLTEISAPYIQEISTVIQNYIARETNKEAKEALEYVRREISGVRPSGNTAEISKLRQDESRLLEQLQNSDATTSEINANYDRRISVIQEMMNADSDIQQKLADIDKKYTEDPERLAAENLKNTLLRQNKHGTEDFKLVTKHLKDIDERYQREKNTVIQQWVAQQSEEIDKVAEQVIENIRNGIVEDQTENAIREFREKTGSDVKSKSDMERVINEIRENAHKEAEAATMQAIANIDQSGVISQEEIERQIAETRAKAEDKKRKAIEEFSKKSDTEVMAMHHETASQTLDASAEASRAHARQLKAEQEADMARYGITKEMVETANLNATAANELIEARNRENDAVNTASTTARTSPSSQSFTGVPVSGFVGAFDISNLATESTLRGIYQLLNGGPPDGGWDSAAAIASGIKEELDLSVHSFSSVLSNLASSVGQFAKNVSGESHEKMTFFNEKKNVGEYLEGKENVIDANTIKGFLDGHKGAGLKLALHNHPDGISALSPADIESAIALSNMYGIGASGVVTNEKVTGVDFSEVSKEIGLKILDAYKNNIRKSKFADIFDDNFDIKPEYANLDDASKHTLSDALNKCLRDAITAVGLDANDVFGQVDVSQLDDTVRQIADTIVQDASKTAMKAATDSGSGVAQPKSTASITETQSGDARTKLANVEAQMAASDARKKALNEEWLKMNTDFAFNFGIDRKKIKDVVYVDQEMLDTAAAAWANPSARDSNKHMMRNADSGSDIVQALVQMYRFPEKYDTIPAPDGNRTIEGMLSQSQTKVDRLFPLGNGKNLALGSIADNRRRRELRAFDALGGFVPKVLDDNGADLNPRQSTAAGASHFFYTHPEYTLEMSADELRASPVIQQAYADYVEQRKKDDIIEKFIGSRGKLDGKPDALKAAIDRYHSLEQQMLAEQEEYDRLSDEKKTIEQEIISEEKTRRDKVEDTSRKTATPEINTTPVQEAVEQVANDIVASASDSVVSSTTSVTPEVNVEPIQQASEQIAEAVVETGTQATIKEDKLTTKEVKEAEATVPTQQVEQTTTQVADDIVEAGAESVIDATNTIPEPEVPIQPIQEAATQVAEAVVETGTQAANSTNFTNEDITAKQTAFQEKFKTKDLGNGKKGFEINGANKINQALYNVGDRLTKASTDLTDVDLKKLQTAYGQLVNGLQEDIAQHLDQDALNFLNQLKTQLGTIVDENAGRITEINKPKTSIAKKDYNSAKHNVQSVDKDSVSMAADGITQVYDILSNKKSTLSNDDLRTLGTGYFKLVETVNHEIFASFNDQTKQVLQTMQAEALATLDKYGVKVLGTSDLQGKVLSDENAHLINRKNAGKNGGLGKVFTDMSAPAIVRSVTKDDGTIKENVLQTAQGRLQVEQKITFEKQKQNQLAAESTQKESKATTEVQERAQAEQKVAENKKKDKTTKPKVSSDGVTTQPSKPTSVEGSKNQGGILGLLGRIAQETTLQSVLTQLSKGVKTSSGGEGGKRSGKSSQETDTVLSDSEALGRLQEKIKADYPEFASVGNSRAVSGGHAIDVFQYKNLDQIKEARADIERLNAEGKAGTEEWNEAQQRLNALLTEQEKITLKINTATGEITTKSSFQNLAVGAKAATKELQNVDSMMSQLHDAGALSLGADGSVSSSNQSVQNYLNSLDELRRYKNSLSQDMLFDPSTQQQLSQLTLATQNYRKEVMSLLNTTAQLNRGEKIGDLVGGIDGLDDNAIMKSMKDIVEQSNDLEKTFGKLTPVTNEFGEVVGYQLAYSVRTSKNTVQEMTASLNPLTNELRVQKGEVKEVATGWQQFFAGLKGKAASIMQYLISITSIHDVFRYVGQGVQYVREIDGALTELKKVTDETDASYAKFLQDMSKTGSVIGATVADLTTSAADWARLGSIIKSAPLYSDI